MEPAFVLNQAKGAEHLILNTADLTSHTFSDHNVHIFVKEKPTAILFEWMRDTARLYIETQQDLID